MDNETVRELRPHVSDVAGRHKDVWSVLSREDGKGKDSKTGMGKAN